METGLRRARDDHQAAMIQNLEWCVSGGLPLLGDVGQVPAFAGAPKDSERASGAVRILGLAGGSSPWIG